MKSQLRESTKPLCKRPCNNNQCSLPCLKNQHKESEGHNCKTDHKCHFRCEIEDVVHLSDEELPMCNYPAGHRNRHKCKMQHMCTHICKYNTKGCLYKCSKEIDHEGEHLCDAIEHYCGEPCSLSKPGLYECMGACAISVGIEHKEHKCETQGCPISCCIDECGRICQSSDHLHALQHGVEYHFCR